MPKITVLAMILLLQSAPLLADDGAGDPEDRLSFDTAAKVLVYSDKMLDIATDDSATVREAEQLESTDAVPFTDWDIDTAKLLDVALYDPNGEYILDDFIVVEFETSSPHPAVLEYSGVLSDGNTKVPFKARFVSLASDQMARVSDEWSEEESLDAVAAVVVFSPLIEEIEEGELQDVFLTPFVAIEHVINPGSLSMHEYAQNTTYVKCRCEKANAGTCTEDDCVELKKCTPHTTPNCEYASLHVIE